MQAIEERYKKCIEKAKATISTLDTKPNAEVAALKNQLLEKNNIIQKFERDEERKKQDSDAKLRLVYHQCVRVSLSLARASFSNCNAFC